MTNSKESRYESSKGSILAQRYQENKNKIVLGWCTSIVT